MHPKEIDDQIMAHGGIALQGEHAFLAREEYGRGPEPTTYTVCVTPNEFAALVYKYPHRFRNDNLARSKYPDAFE